MALRLMINIFDAIDESLEELLVRINEQIRDISLISEYLEYKRNKKNS
ncbi:MAG: hypothetical protein L6U99_10310 [Clostridium sp.]|nr:MAG: hypothetical protein L6U99_10310 [Clostridium sp.]